MLPQFPGSTGTFPTELNANGHITGIWIDPNRNTEHSFLLVNGSFTGLDDPEAGKLNCTGVGLFGYPNCSTLAAAINDNDQIVGFFVKDDGTTHGFLLSQGIYTTVDFPGAVVTTPSGINDAGQIVGGYVDSSGVSHGFLARAH
jgi:probable HAF family extracellular repeat protein